MASISHPATFPYYFDQSGFSLTTEDPVLISEMETGPRKKRLRYTATVEKVSGQMTMTTTERNNLYDFYKNLTSFGVSAFKWIHPITQASCEMRFVAPPSFSPKGLDWVASLDLEILP